MFYFGRARVTCFGLNKSCRHQAPVGIRSLKTCEQRIAKYSITEISVLRAIDFMYSFSRNIDAFNNVLT